ncbi:MAG TPA: hypothetical protein VFI42_16660 [Thermomicrobiaceae bacterium]|nr:hypothetical protein [Thermomicrobiaceae bacterium]
MAVMTRLYHSDGLVELSLYPGEPRVRVADDPDERLWPYYLYWDEAKLERGEREFVGIEVFDVSDITADWLAALEQLDLPRIDVPEAGLQDVSVADALRWAKAHFPSRLPQPAPRH